MSEFILCVSPSDRDMLCCQYSAAGQQEVCKELRLTKGLAIPLLYITNSAWAHRREYASSGKGNCGVASGVWLIARLDPGFLFVYLQYGLFSATSSYMRFTAKQDFAQLTRMALKPTCRVVYLSSVAPDLLVWTLLTWSEILVFETRDLGGLTEDELRTAANLSSTRNCVFSNGLSTSELRHLIIRVVL